MTSDLEKEIIDLQCEVLIVQTNKLIANEILYYYEIHPELSSSYKDELLYIKENRVDITFPYKHLKSLGNYAPAMIKSLNCLMLFTRERGCIFQKLILSIGRKIYIKII